MNIDEFLDSVALQNKSKTPILSTEPGAHQVPSDALVRSVMQSKFDAIPKLLQAKAGPQANTATQVQRNQIQTQTAAIAEISTASISRSPSSSVTPAMNGEQAASAVEQFQSLSVALETSLASADYQHAFDTYIALQSTLAHLHEQQKKQQRTFQEELNQFKTRLFNAVQESTVQFQAVMQELYLQIGQIKQLVDENKIDAATNQYTSVKQTLDQLPNNFADKKERLQDELLKVYLYLKNRSETHTANSFSDISTEMKRLYVSAVAAIKIANWAQAQQLYEQLAAKYAQLPDGFTEQKVQLFDYVTFLHSQLTLEPSANMQATLQNASSINTKLDSPQLQSQSMQSQVTATPTTQSQAPRTAQQTKQTTVPRMPSAMRTLTPSVNAKIAPAPSPSLLTAVNQPTATVPIIPATQTQATITATTKSPRAFATNIPAPPTPQAKVTDGVGVPQQVQNASAPQPQSAQQTAKTTSKIPPPPASLLDEEKPTLFSPNPKPEIILTQRAAAKQPEQKAQPTSIPTATISQSKPQSTKPFVQQVPSQATAQAAAKSSSEKVSALDADEVSTEIKTQSAQQLQERAKKLAARLEELKKSLDN